MEKEWVLTAFLIAGLSVSAGSACAATYYVCNDFNSCNSGGGSGWGAGSDSNSLAQAESKMTPWQSVQKAADNVVAGDIVIVGSSLYTDTDSDKYVVKFSKPGSVDDWIAFRAENDKGAVIDCENVDGSYGFLIPGGVNYLRLEGFSIKNCDNGIFSNPPPDSPVTNIYIYRCSLSDIARKTFNNDYGRSGIFTGSYTRYFTVDSCIISNVGRLPGGSYPDGKTYHDYVHDHGFYAQGAGHVVKNSVFYNMYAGWAVKIDGYLGDFPENESKMIVTNSVFANDADPFDDHDIAYHGGHIVFYVNPAGYGGKTNNFPRNVIIQNDVFYNPPVSIYGGVDRPDFAVQAYNLAERMRDPVLGGAVIRNCVTNAQRMVNLPDGYDNSVFKKYSQNSDRESNPDLNNSDMGLEDVINNDFALTAEATYLIDKGYADDHVPSFDILGIPRDPFPDIGAYEYAGTSGYCRDGFCDTDAGEDCSTCTEDCGTCQTNQASIARWTFDEGSGSQAVDSSGNGNTGTLVNSPAWTVGRFGGNALHFDGVDDYVEASDSVSLNPVNITIMMWFKPDDLTDNAGLIAKGDNNHRQYWAWIYQGNLSLEIGEGGYHNYIYPLQADAWYHLAVTYDGSDIITYINGTEVSDISQATGPILTDDDPLLMGMLPGFQHFNGTIDDVRIYSYALNPQDVYAIANPHRSDTNHDGCLKDTELTSFIGLWYADSTTNTMAELMEAVGLWKAGTGCHD